MSGITKSMLIERIATHYPALPHKDVELAVKAIFDRMSRQLVEGGRLSCADLDHFHCTSGKRVSVEIPKPVSQWFWTQKPFLTLSRGKSCVKRSIPHS